MKTFGIIGYPLAHSFSQKYFSQKFLDLGLSDHEFKTFPIENINSFPDIIRANPGLNGLSVTIPHKLNVIPFLNELNETAKAVGAVNCIKVQSTRRQVSRLTGYNTDVFGFKQALKPFLDSHHNKALILGTGGASKAVAYVLKEIGVEYYFVTRKTKDHKSRGITRDGEQASPQLTTTNVLLYEDLDVGHLSTFKLIVNTTPLGMYPNESTSPDIPYQFLTPKHFCFDLVYNPGITLFLAKAKAFGALTQNGLTMLHQQAEKAWEIWNG